MPDRGPPSLAARQRAWPAEPPARWQERTLEVDGRPVPARWLGRGDQWIAHAGVGDVRVVVHARDLSVEEVALVRVEDLGSYAPPTP